MQINQPNLPGQIFESHFTEALTEEEYSRARAIFDSVGAYNERRLAIQFHVANHAGRLPDVLDAYDKLIAPESWYYNVPNPALKAVEVRLYADEVYGSVICEGDQDRLLELLSEVDVPKIFDLMDQY